MSFQSIMARFVDVIFGYDFSFPTHGLTAANTLYENLRTQQFLVCETISIGE